MKKQLVSLMLAGLMFGCASSRSCVHLVWPTPPDATVCAALAASQPATTTAEVQAWFAQGNRDFLLAATHTNAIALALKSGAIITR